MRIDRLKPRRPALGTVLGFLALVVVLGTGTALGAITQASNGARRIDFRGDVVDAAPANPGTTPAVHKLIRLDELTIKASCINAGGSDARVYVTFASTVAGDINWQFNRFDNPGTVAIANGSGFGAGGGTYGVVDMNGGNRFLNGQFIYRNSLRTITVSLFVVANGSFGTDSCIVEGTALPAPS
jgi:hypothetical protein